MARTIDEYGNSKFNINEKLVNSLLETDEKLDERADSYDQNKKYEGFLDIDVE